MGLFHRKKKPPKETNEMNNKALKEQIANAALQLLQKNVDYQELAYTKVEFGYLFRVENHGIETLFKVITDKTTAYFALQGENLMRLEFNEELYRTTIDGVLDSHKTFE